jgi:GDP-L-fucose synthase
MKTILITGGSGLVGSAIQHIADNYSNKYNFLYLSRKTCDLLNYEETLEYFTANKPNYVIHLAANVGGLFKNMEQPVQMLEDNLIININVLKAAHNVKVEKLVACLSTCIFPDAISYPIFENDLHLGPPHSSNAAYAYSKRILQTLCESYKSQYKDNFMCIIPTNIYGPHDNFHLQDAHVIPALIHKCFLAKSSGEKFSVSGSGSPLRQFIYSQDLAHTIMWVLENYEETNTIMLAPDEKDEVTIEFVARAIAKEFDYEEFIEFDRTKADGQYKKTVSNKIFKKYNPEYLFITPEEGIKKTVTWFKNNYASIRK